MIRAMRWTVVLPLLLAGSQALAFPHYLKCSPDLPGLSHFAGSVVAVFEEEQGVRVETSNLRRSISASKVGEGVYDLQDDWSEGMYVQLVKVGAGSWDFVGLVKGQLIRTPCYDVSDVAEAAFFFSSENERQLSAMIEELTGLVSDQAALIDTLRDRVSELEWIEAVYNRLKVESRTRFNELVELRREVVQLQGFDTRVFKAFERVCRNVPEALTYTYDAGAGEIRACGIARVPLD